MGLTADTLLKAANASKTSPAEPSSILHVHSRCSIDHTYYRAGIYVGARE